MDVGCSKFAVINVARVDAACIIYSLSSKLDAKKRLDHTLCHYKSHALCGQRDLILTNSPIFSGHINHGELS